MLTPRSGPAVSRSQPPRRGSGRSCSVPGPWTAAPTAPRHALLLFQGRLGASAGNPALPSLHRIRSGGTIPAALAGGCQSEPAAPPRSVRAPPHLPRPERLRMRPGEAARAGTEAGTRNEPRHPDWSPGARPEAPRSSELDRRDTLCMTGCERGRDVMGAGNQRPRIHLEPPFLLPRPSSFQDSAATSARPRSQADGPWSGDGAFSGPCGDGSRRRRPETPGSGRRWLPAGVALQHRRGSDSASAAPRHQTRLPEPQSRDPTLKDLKGPAGSPSLHHLEARGDLGVRSRVGTQRSPFSNPPSSRSSLGGAD